MSEIKKNLLKSIIFLIAITLTSLSLYISIMIYNIKINDTKKILTEKNNTIRYLINNLFIKIKNYIGLLSSDERVIYLNYISPQSQKDILKMFQNLKKIDFDIRYIYSGYENGEFFINNYIPPKGYDPRVRPWYKAAVNTFPDISTGLPYRDIKTNELLISFSKALVDNFNTIHGVIAIDLSFNKVIKILSENNYFKCFVVNKNGKIIIHPDIKLLNTDYNNINQKNKNKLTFIQPIKSLGWKVVTEVDKAKIISPIIYQILISNLIILMIVLFIGWYLSVSFTKKFVTPIVELKNRVEAIFENKIAHAQIDNFKYPENEIGIIAKKIENLTQNELLKKNKELTLLSQTDQLTKLYNRRYILDALEEEIKRAKRYNTMFSIILFDIDHFKQVNDVFGHNYGDDVLKEISKLTMNSIRETDIAGRWGGEEFIILCCNTDGKNAKFLAEKLRKIIENHDFPVDRQITISCGVASYHKGAEIKEIINNADKKLYEAKKSGRNRVVF